MKVKLLKKFRKRFEVRMVENGGYILIDRYLKKIHDELVSGKKIRNLSDAVAVGVGLIMSADEMYFTMMDYIRVRRARQEAIKYRKYTKNK